MTRRLLVVNADDFGQSAGINRGIIEACERGIVTSASLMVRHPGAGEAAAYARAHGLDLGLHVDLGEWMYAEERWTALYEVVPLDDGAGIAREVERQLDRFRQLVGRDPTHLDSHQHVHGRSPALEVLVAIADRLRVPLRGVTPGVRYCGDFYGQTAEGAALPEAITSEALLRILRGLPGGCTELGCHPGHDDGLSTMYRTERAQEVATLCDPRVRQTIVALGIELCSFDELDKPVTDVPLKAVCGRGKDAPMDLLLPDRLKELWRRVERAGMTPEAFAAEQTGLLDACRAVWSDALRLGTHETLEESLVAELGAYVGCDDLDEVRARCRRAVADLKREWEEGEARAGRPDAVARFYDRSEVTLYELTWWHTLTDDLSPLSYVVALQFATRHEGRAYLDFGAGVGSGAILFARHGFDVTVADIASPLRTYTRWRLGRRGLKADELDLRTTSLPGERFDFITAMDVFEHLVDPVGTAEHIWDALRPGGFLYGRFGCEPDDSHPMHIVEDFEPTLARLRELGGVEVWRDEWLWGHQVFRKPPAPGAGAP